MGLLRPATPGFIVTLVATILLALVSFCVPIIKSIYFLKASISVDSYSGNITFGTLGYCLYLSNGTTCSKPAVGYELDVDSLLGDDTSIDIPQVVVKWLTYALVLHIVAFAFAAGSAFFGLLAHVREMAMTCCSTCISGFAAAIALVAFIFDIVLFYVTKARVDSIGTATIGSAIWLTLAAWVLLFFSGCFYTIGRCCMRGRPSRGGNKWDTRKADPNSDEERLRLDAVKAEADRKARQNQKEVGLPAFHERVPLTARVDGDAVYSDDPLSSQAQNAQGGYTGGYVQAPLGTRAVDDYYNPTDVQRGNSTGVTYPPQAQVTYNAPNTTPLPLMPTSQYNAGPAQSAPRRQASAAASSVYSTNSYNAPQTTSPPLMPTSQYNAGPAQSYATPMADYGQTQSGTPCMSFYASHDRDYSTYDPYNQQAYNSSNTYAQPAATADPYASQQSNAYATNADTAYYTASTSPPHEAEQSYTLNGDGYHQSSGAYGASTSRP
ncbi:pali-domain-containing protein, partial [Fistulina hepatica ATCC 64428]